jgi:formate dehydrogenase major subunit
MGSNMAEQHPVGFQWVIEAKERGAKVMHVDPRFTRTSAMADFHVPLRAGTDIAFLGGVINYILAGRREFSEYVRHFTNARVIVKQAFRDTDELDGLFSGFDAGEGAYDASSWGYEDTAGETPAEDWTLEHRNCVFQILKRHFARYTPEMVQRICGVPREKLVQVAETLCRNSGRERTSAVCYAVGWTQHTHGVQNIRAASILQLLLGNIGRPGGGILALRGHANIQGSTDIPTLYDILPGYIPMPHPSAADELDRFVQSVGPDGGVWGGRKSYVVSLLRAWWGQAAAASNDFAFSYLPRIDGDHSHYPMMLRMIDGETAGFIVIGQNPVVGSANSGLQRKALANLEWLVVRDVTEIETAAFWYDSPEVEAGETGPEQIGTEVFFLPAAAHTEKDGTFTNTQRLLQWHHKAVEPPGDCRSDLWFTHRLGQLVRARLAASRDAKDRPILDLTWDYPLRGPQGEPDAEAIMQEVSGRRADGSSIASYEQLSDDGSTACGSWIHAGLYAGGINRAARKRPGREQSWIAPEWGWAWPANRRIIYNRASADPDGHPWSERKRYVWWDPAEKMWTGLGDVPDCDAEKAPDYKPARDARGMAAIDGASPFILHADGLAWLYVADGLVDGPLPAHYEPHESPFANELYAQRANPTRQTFARPENPYNPSGGQPAADVFPFVLSTYRLTEHHTAGAMTRTVPHLAELQPEFFCEVSPALASERGLQHGGWATIATTRTAIEARVLVTDRIQPLRVQDRVVHQVGIPYHWGRKGLVTGDSGNELLALVLDANVHISEYKAATCDIRPGRRPRGRALKELVDEYRRRAGVMP